MLPELFYFKATVLFLSHQGSYIAYSFKNNALYIPSISRYI